jgi:hypothetical protein
MSDTKLTDSNVSAIDKALNQAKARKAAKDGTEATPKAPRAAKAAKAPSEPKRPRVSDEEKAARKAKKDAELAANRAARAAVRLAKNAEKAANKPAAHLKKVERAAARLSPLSASAQLLFGEATASLTASELANLAIHIGQFNREQSTVRALGIRLTAGQNVTIVGGDPRFVGRTGTVVKSQRIRCYVAVDGVKKALYMFSSDVVPATQAAAATA